MATIELRPMSLLLDQMLCVTRFSTRSLPRSGFDQATVPTAAVVGPATTHRSDLLQLGDDDFLSHAPEWLIASVTEFGLRHLNGTLMVRHHHRHKVGIDIARWPDTHVDHHLCHRADILGEVRTLRGRRGTKRLRADW